ncbi:hypothetical protein K0M31_002083, partial [Melipona bicolor]
ESGGSVPISGTASEVRVNTWATSRENTVCDNRMVTPATSYTHTRLLSVSGSQHRRRAPAIDHACQPTRGCQVKREAMRAKTDEKTMFLGEKPLAFRRNEKGGGKRKGRDRKGVVVSLSVRFRVDHRSPSTRCFFSSSFPHSAFPRLSSCFLSPFLPPPLARASKRFTVRRDEDVGIIGGQGEDGGSRRFLKLAHVSQGISDDLVGGGSAMGVADEV